MDGKSLASTGLMQRQWWLIAALVAVFLTVNTLYAIKAAENRSAIVRFLYQLREFDSSDRSIYDRFSYPHPPLMALALRQLARLPLWTGALIWFYLKVGLTVLATVWVFRLVEDPASPFPAWAKWLTVLLSLRPEMGDLSHGNVNLLILFLLVASLFAYHRGRDWVAGLLLGLTIVCRLTPALFLPYFAWKRQWKVCLGCLAGVAIFLFVVPACFLGAEQNANLVKSWALHWIWPYVVQGQVLSEHNNQSLPALIFRLLTHSPGFAPGVDGQSMVPVFFNFIALDPRIASWLVKGLLILFAGLIVWTCRTSTSPRAGWRLAAELSLIILGTLLFTERTWKHHCVTLLVPFAVLSYCLTLPELTRRLRFYIIATLATVMLLMATTSTGLFPEALFGDFAKLAQVYGAYVWAHLLLVAALMVMLKTDAPNAGVAIAPVRRAKNTDQVLVVVH